MENLFQLNESEIKQLEGLMENSKPADETSLDTIEFGGCRNSCESTCHAACENDCYHTCDTTCKGNSR